jgi:hypothetical protein
MDNNHGSVFFLFFNFACDRGSGEEELGEYRKA